MPPKLPDQRPIRPVLDNSDVVELQAAVRLGSMVEWNLKFMVDDGMLMIQGTVDDRFADAIGVITVAEVDVDFVLPETRQLALTCKEALKFLRACTGRGPDRDRTKMAQDFHALVWADLTVARAALASHYFD